MPGAPPVALMQSPSRVEVHHYRRGRDRTSGMLAALLSFLLPGLGQMCQGRILTGVCFLLLALITAIPLVFLYPLGLAYLAVVIIAAAEAAQY